MSQYVGIDPGKNGCIAVFSQGRTPVFAFAEPSDFGINYTLNCFENVRAVTLEKVNSHNQGVVGAFNFGGSYRDAERTAENIIKNHNAIYQNPIPQEWQKVIFKHFNVSPAVTGKARALYCAKQIAPGVDFEITSKGNKKKKGFNDNMSDALCIAYYGYIKGF